MPPPHNTEEVKVKLKDLVRIASKKGIRIIPVVAGKTNQNTEFIMNIFGIMTNGTYTSIPHQKEMKDLPVDASSKTHNSNKFNDLLLGIIMQYTTLPNAGNLLPAPKDLPTN